MKVSLFAFTSAPCNNKVLTVLIRAQFTALIKAVHPLLSCKFISAPCDNKVLTVAVYPFPDAFIKAVVPS